MDVRTVVQTEIEQCIQVIEAVAIHMQPNIEAAARTIARAFEQSHKILIVGNGGSAADCQHMASEFVGRFRIKRGGFPAIALTTDTSVLTAVANDFGYDDVFGRQIEALVIPGDIVLGISTSGNSANVVQGIRSAKQRGSQCIGLTGRTGGQLGAEVDCLLAVPSEDTARIQEAHLMIIHILVHLVEQLTDKQVNRI